MAFKFLKTSFFLLLAGFALLIIGIIVIVIEQNVGYGEHGSYGAVPAILGILLLLVSGYSFIKAVAVKVTLFLLPKELKEFLQPKEEEVSFSVDTFSDNRRDVNDRTVEREYKEDPNKSARSVVTRNR